MDTSFSCPMPYLSIVDASVPELLEAERVLEVDKRTDGKSCRLMDTVTAPLPLRAWKRATAGSREALRPGGV